MSHPRLPVSSRHAFALAFDLAVRRDRVQSILVPLLLQTPWFVLLGMLPSLEESRAHLVRVMLLTVFVLLGQTFTWLLVSGALRYRARSVFNTPAGRHPMGVAEAYGKALRRVPSLFVTEVLRNVSFSIGGLFLVLPALFLGFKLSMATEDVVLRPTGPFGAFKRSFRITEGRWERWMEMIVLSVVIVLGVWFLAALAYVGVPSPGPDPYAKAALILVFAILPVIQYAWTFFYLRLDESDAAALAVEAVVTPREEMTPAPWRGSATPRLKLVEVEREEDEDESPR
jgi:hypothetical protein